MTEHDPDAAARREQPTADRAPSAGAGPGEPIAPPPGTVGRPGAAAARSRDSALPDHPVRQALLQLLAEVGAVTATEAAARLGYSSGLCSFHLRQLARHGQIEEAPSTGGRARPWRLRRTTPSADTATEDAFGDLARGLEDESWQRWLARRDSAPVEWRHDEAFSAIAYLTPEELKDVAAAVRQALAPYRHREHRPLARPEGALPVALIARLFPLLPEAPDDSRPEH